jgi:hypothetical protein
MIFREINAVYYKKYKKHINTISGQNAEFLNVKARDT